jgi:hypothetical protein
MCNADKEGKHTVLRNCQPVPPAANIKRLQELQELDDDLACRAFATLRASTASDTVHRLDDVLLRSEAIYQHLREHSE